MVSLPFHPTSSWLVLATCTIMFLVGSLWYVYQLNHSPDVSMMENVYWTLGAKKYDSYSSFIRAVEDECQRVDPEGHDWDPNGFVCDGPISIVYEVFSEDPPDDMIYFLITDQKKPVTQGELLFALNNASYEHFKDDDHKFFEGVGTFKRKSLYLSTGSWPY